jgi:hypothetical protein
MDGQGVWDLYGCGYLSRLGRADRGSQRHHGDRDGEEDRSLHNKGQAQVVSGASSIIGSREERNAMSEE